MNNSFFLTEEEDIEKHFRGLLPHWEQPGKMQFITFRLADSLPKTKKHELKLLKEQYKKEHPDPWDAVTKIGYYRIISRTEEQLLDNGYGSCILSDKMARQCLSNTIHFFNRDKYLVIAYVIMPNHVHILLISNPKFKISSIIQSIKRHSAREINKIIGKKGILWMKEYYDRIIRNSVHLCSCLNYIKCNPRYFAYDKYELYVDNELIRQIGIESTDSVD